MSLLIGHKVTRFWYGERYVFERVDTGKWKCVYQDTPLIPADMIRDLGD